MNVQETLRTIMWLPPKQSILLLGPHGIGKSQVVRQAASQLSVLRDKMHEFIDIRLSQREVGDIIGMPRRADTFDVTKRVFANGQESFVKETVKNVSLNDLPTWFPQDQESCGLLFFDELDRATQDVQQAAFEAVLDYRMNLTDIPKGWRIISAINADDNKYNVHPLDHALLDRFLAIPFRPTVSEWESWAVGKSLSIPVLPQEIVYVETVPIHDAIMKFISKMPSCLDTPEVELEPMKVYQSRRSWTLLSNAMKFAETNGQDLLKDLHYLQLLSSGYIGIETASEFITFIQKDYKVYTPKDILDKMDKEIEDAFKNMLVHEVAFYSKELVKYLSEKKVKLTKKQSENLKKFYFAIDKEAASGFWREFTEKCREEASKWYKADKDIIKLTMSLIRKADALASE